MTDEQIAELRGLTHMCRGGLPPCECDIPEALGDDGKSRNAPLPVLQRLLEERKLLLEAVKNLAVVTDGRGACTAPQCLRSYLALVEPYKAARSAIAFAEGPA